MGVPVTLVIIFPRTGSSFGGGWAGPLAESRIWAKALVGASRGDSLSLKKMPFITSVNLVQIDGRSVVPTVVFYDSSKRAHIGTDARDRCPSPEQLIEDFKIELGQSDQDAVSRQQAWP